MCQRGIEWAQSTTAPITGGLPLSTFFWRTKAKARQYFNRCLCCRVQRPRFLSKIKCYHWKQLIYWQAEFRWSDSHMNRNGGKKRFREGDGRWFHNASNELKQHGYWIQLDMDLFDSLLYRIPMQTMLFQLANDRWLTNFQIPCHFPRRLAARHSIL